MKRILALALLALLAGSGPAAADPISLAIGALVSSIGSIGATVGAFVTGLGVLGKALISIGLSLALSFVSSLFRPKQKKAEGGVQSQIQIGGDVPRSAIFGKQATAGHIVYVNTYGTNNAMLDMVFAIGDGQHEGLSRVWVNGKEHGLTQPGVETHYVVDDFDSKLTLTFVSGGEDQAALAALVTNANPAGRWTNDHTLSGIAYIVARMQFDEKVFPNSIPQLLFEMEGLKLYDPRLDSTNGGSGSHRWDNPSTWAYSENPAIQLYNYQRGIYLNGERVLGMGLPAADLNTESYVAAANICDESVSLLAGGTEPRYRCGFNVSDGMQHSEVIDRFVEAMGGVIAERAGQYTVFAGVAQSSVVTITDGDLVVGKPRTYSAKKSRTERVNAVFGTYSNPDEQWKAVAFPAFTSDIAEADDGGERIAVNLDLAQVFSVTQSQRLAMIQRRLGRLQGTAEISLPFAFIRLEAGDWITWNSDRFGFEKVWQVASARIEADQTIRVSLREIATSVFSWVSGDDELDVVQPGVGPSRPPLAGGVSSFAVAASSYVGESLSIFPTIRATWTGIEDETVIAVLTEHRAGSSGDGIRTVHQNTLGGVGIISDGIQPDTYYEVRATIQTVPAREVSWTAWKSVVTSNGAVPAGAVTYQSLSSPLRQTIDSMTGFGADSIRDLLRQYEERLEAQGEAVARAVSQTNILLAKAENNSTASIVEERSVRASADEANATLITGLSASLDTLDGTVTGLASTVSETSATVTTQGGTLTALASDLSTLTATVGTTSTTVSGHTTAITNLEGETYGSWGVQITTQKNVIGTTVKKVSGFKLHQAGGAGETVSEFRIDSDKFSIFPAGSDPDTNTYDTPLFSVGTVGVSSNRAGLNALAILNGTLQSRMLVADEVVVANTIQLQNSIVTVPHVVTYSTPVAGTGIGNLLDVVDTMFEVTIPSGQTIPIFFNGGMSLEYLNTSTTRWDLDFKVSWRNVGGSYGSESSLFAMTCGSTATVSAPFGGAYSITGTGAIQQVRARLVWTAESNIRAGNRYLSCQAAKR